MNRYPNYRPHFAARGQQHRPPFRERFHGGHNNARGRHMNPISVPFPDNNTHMRGPRPRFQHAYDIGNAQSNMGPRGYQPNAQIRHHNAYPRLPMGNTTAGVRQQNHIHMTEDSGNGISRPSLGEAVAWKNFSLFSIIFVRIRYVSTRWILPMLYSLSSWGFRLGGSH